MFYNYKIIIFVINIHTVSKKFSVEKEIIRKASLSRLLPKLAIKRVSEITSIAHPTVSYVASGVTYNPEIFYAVRKELRDAHIEIGIALKILEVIKE